MADSVDPFAGIKSSLAEAFAPIKQSHRVQKLMDDIASPFHEMIQNSALSKLSLQVAQDQIEIPGIRNLVAKAQSDPYRNPHWPALSQLPVAEFSQPLKVDLAEIEPPEPQPWWKQGWVWGAIGSGLVLVDIILRLLS